MGGEKKKEKENITGENSDIAEDCPPTNTALKRGSRIKLTQPKFRRVLKSEFKQRFGNFYQQENNPGYRGYGSLDIIQGYS